MRFQFVRTAVRKVCCLTHDIGPRAASAEGGVGGRSREAEIWNGMFVLSRFGDVSARHRDRRSGAVRGLRERVVIVPAVESPAGAGGGRGNGTSHRCPRARPRRMVELTQAAYLSASIRPGQPRKSRICRRCVYCAQRRRARQRLSVRVAGGHRAASRRHRSFRSGACVSRTLPCERYVIHAGHASGGFCRRGIGETLFRALAAFLDQVPGSPAGLTAFRNEERGPVHYFGLADQICRSCRAS